MRSPLPRADTARGKPTGQGQICNAAKTVTVKSNLKQMHKQTSEVMEKVFMQSTKPLNIASPKNWEAGRFFFLNKVFLNLSFLLSLKLVVQECILIKLSLKVKTLVSLGSRKQGNFWSHHTYCLTSPLVTATILSFVTHFECKFAFTFSFTLALSEGQKFMHSYHFNPIHSETKQKKTKANFQKNKATLLSRKHPQVLKRRGINLMTKMWPSIFSRFCESFCCS